MSNAIQYCSTVTEYMYTKKPLGIIMYAVDHENDDIALQLLVVYL